MLPDDLSVEPYAIALPRGDWELRLAVNTALAELYRSGGVLKIFDQWFGRIGLRPGLLLGSAYTPGCAAGVNENGAVSPIDGSENLVTLSAHSLSPDEETSCVKNQP